MRILFCPSIIVLFLFGLASIVYAQQSDNGAAEKIQVATQYSTKDELLLFWDEKDLYVQSATRYEKPISQVAENMTVVTAKEIEDMNAHTVAEVLNRVTGVFVDFGGQDFGSSSLLLFKALWTRAFLKGMSWCFWMASNGTSSVTDMLRQIQYRQAS